MADLEDRPPPAVGVYWIDEDDYPALLKIFADGNTMPRTWKEWLKIAEEMETGLKAYGHVVMRVRIDPRHISGLVRRPGHEYGPRRTEKIRCGGCHREIRRSKLTSVRTRSSTLKPSDYAPRLRAETASPNA